MTTPEPKSFLGWQNQTVDRETVSKNKMTAMGSTPKMPKKSLNRSVNEPVKSTSISSLGLPLIPRAPKADLDQPNWATLGSRPEDFVDGMKESDRTALNTREYKYYGYFQRIRSRLDQAWIPILREKLLQFHRSGRKLASDMEHLTRVLVFLNETGEITRVQLVSESGISDLDAAAIGAFNQAGPFPNPPKGMIDQNREVQVPWDFILKT